MTQHHEITLDTDGVAALTTVVRMATPFDAISLDTETGGGPDALEAFGDKATFHPYAGSYTTGISVSLNPSNPRSEQQLTGFYVPVGHQRGNVDPGAVRELLTAISESPAQHELHHAVFDWPFLAQVGPFVPSKRTVDTQVLRWLGDENAGKRLKDDLGEPYLGEDAGAEKRGLALAMKSPWENQTHAYKAVREAYPELPVAEARAMARRMRTSRGWHQLEVSELGTYAARDSSLTHEVRGVLDRIYPDLSGSSAFAREMELQHVLYGMTKRGVSVDVLQLETARATYEALAEDVGDGLSAEFHDVLGLKPGAVFNPTSALQVRALLYDYLGLPVMLTTDTGEPSTSKNALEMLQGDKVAGRVLEYRKWAHAASQANGYAKVARLSFDGRLHGHFRSDGTVTGRLSCSGPNMMNSPRDDTNPETQLAFRYTPPGVERYRFDIASAELWVTASITGDPVLTEVLLEGRNLHTEMMVQVFGGEPDKHRREYTLSKNVNYGIEYGAGLDQITTFAAKAGYGPDEARRVAGIARDGHKRLFARQHRVADFLSREAQAKGRLPLHVPGRYRHFESPGKPRVPGYTALNALVQGGVAEFMKDTMLEVVRRGYEELLVLQVHDELWFDGPPGIGQELLELLQSIAYDINPFKYPMRWEPK